MKLLLALLASAIVTFPVAAQTMSPTSPTELQEAEARAAAAEAQSSYLLLHIRRQQAVDAEQKQAAQKKADELAAWWADVWKALPQKE